MSKNAYRVLWIFFFHATSYGSSLFFLSLLPLSLFCWGWISFLSSHHLSIHTPFFQWSKPIPLFASLSADLFLYFFFHGRTFPMHHHLMICPLSILLRSYLDSDISCFHHLFKYPSEIHLHLNIAIPSCLSFGKSYLRYFPPNRDQNCILSPTTRRHLPVGLQMWNEGQSWTMQSGGHLRAVLMSELGGSLIHSPFAVLIVSVLAGIKSSKSLF